MSTITKLNPSYLKFSVFNLFPSFYIYYSYLLLLSKPANLATLHNCIKYKIGGTVETIDLRTTRLSRFCYCFVEQVLRAGKISDNFSNTVHMSGKDIPTFLRSQNTTR